MIESEFWTGPIYSGISHGVWTVNNQRLDLFLAFPGLWDLLLRRTIFMTEEGTPCTPEEQIFS